MDHKTVPTFVMGLVMMLFASVVLWQLFLVVLLVRAMTSVLQILGLVPGQAQV